MQRCCAECLHENTIATGNLMMFGIKGVMLDGLPHYTKKVPSFLG
jgi:hypothetical protein